MWSSSAAETDEIQALQAAQEFAAALVRTPAYQALDQALQRLQQDTAAQAAIRAFQQKQQVLSWQFGLLNDDEQAELDRLEQAMLAYPAVQDYIEAQEQVIAMCQETAALISEIVGLNLGSSGCGCR